MNTKPYSYMTEELDAVQTNEWRMQVSLVPYEVSLVSSESDKYNDINLTGVSPLIQPPLYYSCYILLAL